MSEIKRIRSLDAWRGLAIVGMVIYHSFFDIYYWGIAPGFSVDTLGMNIFAKLIQFSFLIVVGIAMYITFKKKSWEEFKNFQIKRFAIVLLWAMLITVVTYFLVPKNYIRFGILHLIAFSILLITLLAKWRYLQIFVLIGVVAAWVFILPEISVFHEFLVWLGLYPSDFSTLDYFPVLPWMAVPLLGFVFGSFWVKFLSWIDSIWSGSRFLEFCGKHSLAIYLVHQPVLIFLLTVFPLLFGVILRF